MQVGLLIGLWERNKRGDIHSRISVMKKVKES
jgi:hypothetical protein